MVEECLKVVDDRMFKCPLYYGEDPCQDRDKTQFCYTSGDYHDTNYLNCPFFNKSSDVKE